MYCRLSQLEIEGKVASFRALLARQVNSAGPSRTRTEVAEIVLAGNNNNNTSNAGNSNKVNGNGTAESDRYFI